MVVIELTYKKDIADVEAHLESHRAFLDKYYSWDMFLMSGAKKPRDGGIIIANINRQQAEFIIKEDPFYVHDIATYNIIEFSASKYSAELNAII